MLWQQENKFTFPSKKHGNERHKVDFSQFQNNIPNERMLFIVLFTLKKEVIFSSQNAVEKKKKNRSGAPRSADFQSHLQAKLLNSAQHRNKLHQFLHNIYEKLQLWLVQRIKTNCQQKLSTLPGYCFLFIVNT